MRRTALLVPIGSFALAILLSVFSVPASRQVLRAADAPTGGPPPTPPCATWEITKHSAEAKKWHLKVKDMPSTLTNTEPVYAKEITYALVKANVYGEDGGGFGYEETPGLFYVVVGSTAKHWRPGTRVWGLDPQSVQLNNIRRQITEQFSARAVDLLGAPLEGVVVTRLDLIAQDMTFTTAGIPLCKTTLRIGEFVPRDVTFAVTAAGNGAGTR